jgi:hypothetical protein
MDSTKFQRRMTYRLAERTFRYPVYLFLELVWAIAAALAVSAEFLSPFTGWPLALLLSALAIVHSARMTMVHPWFLLKSIVLGAVIFGIALALQNQFAVPTNPLLVATLLASGHYLWQGEQWTRDLAQRTIGDAPKGAL